MIVQKYASSCSWGTVASNVPIFSMIMRVVKILNKCHFSFYAPNFEEVEGAYWFGSVRAVSLSVSLSVSQSVSQSVCLSVMREHSVRNR